MPEGVKVLKLNLEGKVTWQYEGQALEWNEHSLLLEAFFDRDDMPFMGVTLKRGDRFVERFYSDRWYNVFAIYDRDDGKLKGWYCNIGRPAFFGDGTVSYVDLALDLWVTPEGEQTVLDEDEFIALGLDADTHQQALDALAELRQTFAKGEFPP